MSSLKRDRENVAGFSLRTMRSECFLSLKEATRSAILDRVVKGEMTAAEGATRLDLKGLVATFEAGSKTALSVAMACTIVGVVIGMMGAAGVPLKIGDVVLAVTQGRFFPTLVVTMILAVIFGMGMPTTASHVMTSAVAAPALILLGSEPLDAHMFVFYFAALSSGQRLRPGRHVSRSARHGIYHVQ
jgi:TRAP-type uncharacterized transport system fused permease subunit